MGYISEYVWCDILIVWISSICRIKSTDVEGSSNFRRIINNKIFFGINQEK